MLSVIALVGNIGLACSGLCPIEIVQFFPEVGSDLAMLNTPGLFANELAPGDGPFVVKGKVATIRFVVNQTLGAKVIDSNRWGLPFRFEFGSDPFWTAVAWQMKKGEKRSIEWSSSPMGPIADMTIELLEIGPSSRAPSSNRRN